MQACFKLGGRTYCVAVPLVKLPFVPSDRIEEPGRPDPTPWLRGSDIRSTLAHDLSVLATAELLLQQVKSQKLKKQLGQALHESLSVLDAPADLLLSFGHHDTPRDAGAEA